MTQFLGPAGLESGWLGIGKLQGYREPLHCVRIWVAADAPFQITHRPDANSRAIGDVLLGQSSGDTVASEKIRKVLRLGNMRIHRPVSIRSPWWGGVACGNRPPRFPKA